MVGILIETGRANINAQDLHGRTALHVASIRKSIEICRLLYEFGADGSIQDVLGDTPEDIAKRYGSVLAFQVSSEGI